MADLFDYLYWRGDLSLEQSPFGEVDGMILARLSYLPFECVPALRDGLTCNVQSAARVLLAVHDIDKRILLKEDLRLLTALADSARFGGMTLFAYENKTDLETQTQFSAVTVQIEPQRCFVAFRGTDGSFVGWKEDFNMSFICPVPAQTSAVLYVERVAQNVSGRLLTGGHSKGGNLAVYAAAFCSEAVQQRIDAVYNFDGPGFCENVLAQEGYQRICDRVTTFVPQSSVVGMLLEHEEKYIIVHSNANQLMQHDVISWEIERDRFRHLETVTNSSKFIDATLKEWVAQLDLEQREKFFNAIYTVLSETNVHSFRELEENWFAGAISVVKSLANLDEETGKAVTQTLRWLMHCAKSGVLRTLQSQWESDGPNERAGKRRFEEVKKP